MLATGPCVFSGYLTFRLCIITRSWWLILPPSPEAGVFWQHVNNVGALAFILGVMRRLLYYNGLVPWWINYEAKGSAVIPRRE